MARTLARLGHPVLDGISPGVVVRGLLVRREILFGVVDFVQEEACWIVLGLEHGFGAADLARAAQRANPPPELCLELAARLRREKKEMLGERVELAARTRTAVLSGLWAEAGNLRQRLSALDRRITGADEALGDFLVRVRPGAERLAPRRARDVSLTIARARLAATRALILTGVPSGGEDAVRLTRPTAEESAPDGLGKVTVTIKALRR